MNTNKTSKNLIWLIATVVVIGALLGVYFLFINNNSSDENDVNKAANDNQEVNVNTIISTDTNSQEDITNTEVMIDEDTNSSENENINVAVNLNTDTSNDTTTNTETDTNTNATTVEYVNPLMPPLAETVVTASSTLISAGYDYSPSQVIDQDFSTSWVEGIDGDGINEWIKMQFSGAGQINTLGIVPGFARNTRLYQENNRIKTVELEFSDGSTITNELSDEYGIHFIEFPTKNTSYIKMTIKDIYAGTTYADSPVAELDIWSDYVLNKDAEAALAYYEEYKKPAETQPAVKYISNIYMAMGIMGSPTPEIPVNFYSPIIQPFVAAAEIPATTPSGITFTVKWYNEGHLYKTENITSYQAYEGIDTITLSSASYISDLSGPTATAWPLGDFKVEWYENDLLSKSQLFAVTPE
ncbi:hypothetical protein KKF61_00380 [Patescibacteria group bacterium]|nr:hypothetical protein [Patescibacteria group bacterium]MBU0964198.1 hypothetical protein [Patescibacteria group bacterium]